MLLDSHAVFWSLYEPEKLPDLARESISDEENEVFISLATVWELSNKAGAGRLPIGGSTVAKMVERMDQLVDAFLPITSKDITASAPCPDTTAIRSIGC